MPTYSAAQLMKLRTVTPPAIKPALANQIADVIVDPIPPDLCGPGLYALFLDDNLFYIGLHVGEEAEPGYHVLHRWVLHVVGQTLRSPRISFSRRPLQRLFNVAPAGSLIDELAACLPGGRSCDIAALTAHPLVAGSHCTAQKAAFAALHWDVFGPGNEAAMLDRITCLFQPVSGDWEARLANAVGRERGAWVRERWLRDAETKLVLHFRPICNAAIPLGTHDSGFGVGEVEAAIAAALPVDLPAFDRATYDAHVARRRAAPAAVVAAYVGGSDEPLDEATVALAEDEGLGTGELQFRRKLTESGRTYVDDLRDASPASCEVYFTEKPDLRLRLSGERSPLLTLSTANGRLRCFTQVDAETCRRLGHDAQPIGGDGMQASFYIDPTEELPGSLLLLAGAALLPCKSDLPLVA